MTDSTPASNRKPADQLADIREQIRELRDQERVLRTGGARHLLAELFHPGDPPLTDQRVVTRRNPDFGRMLRQLGAAVTYRKAIVCSAQHQARRPSTRFAYHTRADRS